VKVLFTADIHIKVGQKNEPVQWSKDRYHQLFGYIHSLEKKHDVLIVGGDIFDKTPSMEEIELYYDFVSACTIPTLIYAGNHEAVKKNTTFLTNLARSTTWVNNRVRIIDDFYTHEGEIDFIPYNKLKEYHPADVDFHSRILCTHVRGEIPPHVKPEVNLAMFDRWDVVLAGDLHSYENSQRNILYPGSPITTSFHRTRVSTGLISLDTVTLEHEFIELQLPQLIKKTLKAGELPVATDYDHTIYDIEGDMSELAGVQDSELIDKKLNKQSKDTALILTSDMSLTAEVEEYLKYVLNLSDSSVKAILKEMEDYEKISNSL